MKSYFNSLIFIVSLFTSYAVCAVDYDSQIQPIFTSHCTPCHISGSSGSLNLSTYTNVMAGGGSGVVITPEDNTNSYLWQRVNSGAMPPIGVIILT